MQIQREIARAYHRRDLLRRAIEADAPTSLLRDLIKLGRQQINLLRKFQRQGVDENTNEDIAIARLLLATEVNAARQLLKEKLPQRRKHKGGVAHV